VSTSANPPAALVRNAVPAPNRWNTTPSPTPPTSAANPVTGKRVLLLVDRYVVPGAGRYAVADLGTPKGVDNVDAYRMMVGSFRWR